METADLPIFIGLIASMGELYSKAISEPLVDIYWQVLKEFDLQDVQEAFKAHVHNPDKDQYFPKPADVVRFIEGSGETKALQAWSKVEEAVHQVGRYASVAFDDLIIHAVLEEMGGWVKLCSMCFEEMPFRANEFQKRYMGYVNKAPKRYPSYLWGIFECENASHGYAVEPPWLVGDVHKAKQVMLEGNGIPLLVHQPLSSLKKLIQNLPFPKQNKKS